MRDFEPAVLERSPGVDRSAANPIVAGDVFEEPLVYPDESVVFGAGTFHRDEQNVPRGTGWTHYHYETGQLMLSERYRAGELLVSRWYRPDGSLITETRWHNGNGLGLYLHQNGSVRAIHQNRDGLAHGVGWYFDTNGQPEKLILFDRGVKTGEKLLGSDGTL